MPGEQPHRKGGRDLTEGRVLTNLLAMGIPISLAFLFETSYNIVDTMFVGGLGVNALAAVSLSFPLFFIILSIGIGLSVGTNALVSQAIGAKDYKKADNLAEHSFLLALVVGLLVMVLGFLVIKPFYAAFGAKGEILALGEQYMFWILLNCVPFYFTFVGQALLRSEGEAMLPMYILGVSAIDNVVLDYLFIYGNFGFPRMGVAGAGFATFLSDALAVVWLAIVLLNPKRQIRLKPRDFSPKIEFVRQLVVKGLPASLGQTITALGFSLIMFLVGTFGPEAIAAYGAGIRLDQLVVLPIIGISSAVTSIVGQNIGAKKLKRAEWTVLSALKLVFVVELAGGVLMLFFRRPLLGLFTSDATVLAMGAAYLSIVALTYWLRASLIVLTSAFQGAGEMLKALLVMASFYGFAFLFAFALLQFGGHELTYIWWAVVGGTLLSCAIGYTLFVTKRWVPKALVSAPTKAR